MITAGVLRWIASLTIVGAGVPAPSAGAQQAVDIEPGVEYTGGASGAIRTSVCRHAGGGDRIARWGQLGISALAPLDPQEPDRR